MQGQGKAMERGESLFLQNLNIKTLPQSGVSKKTMNPTRTNTHNLKPTKHLSQNTETSAAVLCFYKLMDIKVTRNHQKNKMVFLCICCLGARAEK